MNYPVSIPVDGTVLRVTLPSPANSVKVVNSSGTNVAIFRNDAIQEQVFFAEAGSQRQGPITSGQRFNIKTQLPSTGTVDVTFSDESLPPQGTAGPGATQVFNLSQLFSTQPPNFNRGQFKFVSGVIHNLSGGAADLNVNLVVVDSAWSVKETAVPLTIVSYPACPNSNFLVFSLGVGASPIIPTMAPANAIIYEGTHFPQILQIAASAYPIGIELFMSA